MSINSQPVIDYIKRDREGATTFLNNAWLSKGETVRVLMNAGISPYTEGDVDQPILRAMMGKNTDVINTLLDHPTRSKQINHALNVSSQNGEERWVIYFLLAGADPKATYSIRGSTRKIPLHLASDRNHSSCIRILLAAAPDTLETLTIEEGDNDWVISTFTRRGIDCSQFKPKTPLYFAANCENEEALITLIERGANTSSISPLHKKYKLINRMGEAMKKIKSFSPLFEDRSYYLHYIPRDVVFYHILPFLLADPEILTPSYVLKLYNEHRTNSEFDLKLKIAMAILEHFKKSIQVDIPA